MYLLVILLLAVTMVSGGMIPAKCRGVTFLKKCYDREKLFGNLTRPTNLVVHKYTDDLFFSYTDWSPNTPGLKIRVCNMFNRTCNDVKKVIDGRAVAYHRKNKEIYIGGEALYKYDYATQSASLVEKCSGIWRMFIFKNFYIIRKKLLFIYANNTLTTVPEARHIEIESFFISKYFSIYFSNKTGLYKADKPKGEVYMLSNTVKVNQIAEDSRTGNVFFATIDGIYIDNLLQRNITKVSKIKKAFGLTFWNKMASKYEASRIIYSNYNTIYMLTLSNKSQRLNKKNMRQGLAMFPKMYLYDY